MDNTMDTSDDLRSSYRWAGREFDHATYDLIFTEALDMISSEADKATGTLLMRIINEWERDARSIPVPVIVSALDVATEHQGIRELTDQLRVTFREPPRGMPSGGMNG